MDWQRLAYMSIVAAAMVHGVHAADDLWAQRGHGSAWLDGREGAAALALAPLALSLWGLTWTGTMHALAWLPSTLLGVSLAATAGAHIVWGFDMTTRRWAVAGAMLVVGLLTVASALATARLQGDPDAVAA